MIRRIELWRLVAAEPVARVRTARAVRDAFGALAALPGVRAVHVDTSIDPADGADLILTIDVDDAATLARLTASAPWHAADAEVAALATERTRLTLDAAP